MEGVVVNIGHRLFWFDVTVEADVPHCCLGAAYFANLSSEWWSTVGQLVERRLIRIPNDEKLIAQLTSRRKLYDSKGREKLESKAELASRGVESPDRADALIGAVMLGIGSEALNPRMSASDLAMMQEQIRRMEENPFHVPFIVF
jgi:hypothetical protein